MISCTLQSINPECQRKVVLSFVIWECFGCRLNPGVFTVKLNAVPWCCSSPPNKWYDEITNELTYFWFENAVLYTTMPNFWLSWDSPLLTLPFLTQASLAPKMITNFGHPPTSEVMNAFWGTKQFSRGEPPTQHVSMGKILIGRSWSPTVHAPGRTMSGEWVCLLNSPALPSLC